MHDKLFPEALCNLGAFDRLAAAPDCSFNAVQSLGMAAAVASSSSPGKVLAVFAQRPALSTHAVDVVVTGPVVCAESAAAVAIPAHTHITFSLQTSAPLLFSSTPLLFSNLRLSCSLVLSSAPLLLSHLHQFEDTVERRCSVV